jgi:ribonuclease HI
MGVLIPFTITGKLALQMCSRQGLTWKAKLSDDIREAWNPWMAQVQELNSYSFSRTIIPGEQPNKTNNQIHVSADASKDTYATVAYMRCESNNKVTVRFIQAKLRVRPVKAAHTIPRMELLAIELGLQLVKKIYKTFKIETKNIYIWTDSRACHDWLSIKARALQVFIKNRVLKVRQFLKLKQVKWVPGMLNPADSATRGISAAQQRMDKHWLQGPDFLLGHQDTWPDQPEPPGKLIADLLPATTQGMKLEKKKSEKILIMATCLVNLQPATDHY